MAPNSTPTPGTAQEAFEIFVTDIKDFRKHIDGAIQRAESYLNAPAGMGPMKGAREMALVRTKLQEAKM